MRLSAFYLSSGEVRILFQYTVVTSFSKNYMCTFELATNLKLGNFALENSKTSHLLSVPTPQPRHSGELLEGEKEESTVFWVNRLDYADI